MRITGLSVTWETLKVLLIITDQDTDSASVELDAEQPNPQRSSVEQLPPGMMFCVDYQPDGNHSGTDSFVVTIA